MIDVVLGEIRADAYLLLKTPTAGTAGICKSHNTVQTGATTSALPTTYTNGPMKMAQIYS
jgi:hypothetical protein